ncbi:MAG TPA: DPP IV N-terminal domain-containing protein [Candidatus Acidoferrales bacterium]|jgi:dipeptidyl aminopeptidase/acylaminoacyl peptidase|nr:DPP IV N-terminal domain-containing protein [Candidatus Acidoferrales bacterium]
MIRKALLIGAFCLLPALLPAQVKLLRHPTWSKGRVAFSYLGDIWIANENGSDVQRLTDNQARDVFPRFSPDGNWIAFSSNRDGNDDVYVIPVTGGKPRQLTFHLQEAPGCPARRRRNTSKPVTPASICSPTHRATTRCLTSTARARPITSTSSFRPAITSWR